LNNNKLETRNTSTEAESKEEGERVRQAGRQAGRRVEKRSLCCAWLWKDFKRRCRACG